MRSSSGKGDDDDDVGLPPVDGVAPQLCRAARLRRSAASDSKVTRLLAEAARSAWRAASLERALACHWDVTCGRSRWRRWSWRSSVWRRDVSAVRAMLAGSFDGDGAAR